MKEIFNDILAINDVKSAIFIDNQNEIKIESYAPGYKTDLSSLDLSAFIRAIGTHNETEIHFDNLKLYIRKIDIGWLLIVSGHNVPMAMVRLNCDVLTPVVKSQFEKPTGIGRFFKK